MLTEGVVEAKKDGKMIILAEQPTDVCETCAIRAFCKKHDCDGNRIILNDRPGIKVGDKVAIKETRNILLKTSLLAYGIPLVFFVAGIFLGTLLPELSIPSELIQFASGVAALLVGGLLGRYLAGKLSKNMDEYVLIKVNNKR